MQLHAREMSPPIHVTEEREAIKAPAKSWSFGSRLTGVWRGRCGRKEKERRAAEMVYAGQVRKGCTFFWPRVGAQEVFVE